MRNPEKMIDALIEDLTPKEDPEGPAEVVTPVQEQEEADIDSLEERIMNSIMAKVDAAIEAKTKKPETPADAGATPEEGKEE